MRFEARLAGVVGAVLGLALLAEGCTGEPEPVDLSGACAGEPLPAGYRLEVGWLEIEPGGTCPDVDEAHIEADPCSFYEWRRTCEYRRVEPDQVYVLHDEGGVFVDADSVPETSWEGPVVDLCFYQGVFYEPPDHPTCGRPLLRGDEVVVAGVRSGPSPWSEGRTVERPALSEVERRAAAAWWLGAAVLEHASVASFSVFSLDLLRFGAPPDLLRSAHQAALDEIEHAQRCFALASAFHGAPLAPTELDLQGVGPRSREDVVVALFREGCVGETVAAVDAAARLAGATDPAVVEALQVILRDESEHAAFAWRALRWFLAHDPDRALRNHLAAVVAAERTKVLPSPPAQVSPAAVGVGLLSAAARDRARVRAWDDVIAPAWAELAGDPVG